MIAGDEIFSCYYFILLFIIKLNGVKVKRLTRRCGGIKVK